MMNQFVKNIYESTAEVSTEQGKALAVGTTQVQRQMDSINNQLLATEDGLAKVAALINVCCMRPHTLLSIADHINRLSSR